MFPLDPRAPSKKKVGYWKYVEKFSLILSIILGVTSLIYTSISFTLAKQAYQSSIYQFEISSKASDSQVV